MKRKIVNVILFTFYLRPKAVSWRYSQWGTTEWMFIIFGHLIDLDDLDDGVK